jgi:hypothetical protein
LGDALSGAGHLVWGEWSVETFPLGNTRESIAYEERSTCGFGHPCRHTDSFMGGSTDHALMYVGIDRYRQFRRGVSTGHNDKSTTMVVGLQRKFDIVHAITDTSPIVGRVDRR